MGTKGENIVEKTSTDTSVSAFKREPNARIPIRGIGWNPYFSSYGDFIADSIRF